MTYSPMLVSMRTFIHHNVTYVAKPDPRRGAELGTQSTLELEPQRCPTAERLYDALRHNHTISLGQSTIKALREAREAYLEETRRRNVYGYCTGLGALWKSRGDCGPKWEQRIIEEHARGRGEPVPALVARAFMLSRIIQASQAHAPLRPETLERLVQAYNEGITPQIPRHGSLGASGDLVPTAHLVQCIYQGRGWATEQGQGPPLPCSEALERAGMEPHYPLEPGEALALLNNTSWSTGLLLASSLLIREFLKGVEEAFRRITRVAGCVAEEMDRENLGLKKSLDPQAVEAFSHAPCTSTERLQDPYSIRCTPHVLSPLYALLRQAEELVERELCSPGENPIVHKDRVMHGCHFYAGGLAVYADALSIAVAHAVNLLERQASLLLDKETTGLPEFLAPQGSPVGEMITHYTMAALAARSRQLAAPASVHSLPTSGGQEDIVPQAGEALLKLYDQAILLGDALGLLERLIKAAEELSRGNG